MNPIANRSRYSRRSLIKRVGLGAGLIPILEADFARGAAAFPKRVIVVAWTNGVLADQFFPAVGSIANATLPRCTAPLSDFKSDLLMLSGIEMKNFTAYGNHGAGHESFSSTFTGAKGKEINDGGPRFLGGSPSVDQYIAQELAKKVKLPFASLDLAGMVERYWHQSRCFYRGSDAPVTPEQDPARAFAAVFAGKPLAPPDPAKPPMPLSPASPDSPDRLRAERRSILDFVRTELGAFGARLGKDDKGRVDSHLQSVRELEQQLGVSAPVAGSTPAGMSAPPPSATPTSMGCLAPNLEKLASAKANDEYPKVLDQHIDIIVSALRCDATRVATLMTNNGNGTVTALNWLDVPAKVEFGAKNYHGVAHAGGDAKAKADTWFMERFAYLLRKLKSIREGDGTMLDNTVVLWANHMDNGGGHGVNNLPWILAGKGGGYFQTGRYLRKAGTPTNGVLKALCSAMDINPDGFGDPMFGGEWADLR